MEPRFLLHTYYRSSCSARLRIALNLKGIPTEYAYVRLASGEQQSAGHRRLNPSGTVPVLTDLAQGGASFPITQSIAALEYLEEIPPGVSVADTAAQRRLLPSKPMQRAMVRVLVNVIACDTQPITNRSVTKAVGELGADLDEWQRTYLKRGLQAYEDIASRIAGRYSIGNDVTLADVCLVPCIWNAEMYGVQLDDLPRVQQVYKATMELEAVQKAHWRNQKDSPPDGAWL